MNKFAARIIATSLLVLSAAAVQGKPIPPMVALGVISSDVPEQEMVQPSEIMRSKGTVYGWAALFPYHESGTTRTVTVHESIDVPAAPAAWVLPGNAVLSEGGTHAEMTTTETISERGLIVKPHTFLPGDPLGPWRIRIEIDGQPAGDFRFNVVAPPRPAKKKESI